LNLIRVMPAKGQDIVPTSIFLARLIGPLFLAVGIGALVNRATFRALADEFLRSDALIYLAGVLTMTAGLAIVISHSLWTADWRVAITILGWLATIGGAVRIICPQLSQRMGRAVLSKPFALPAAGAVYIALGAFFVLFGYVR
jgi:uncharacterized membrane protein